MHLDCAVVSNEAVGFVGADHACFRALHKARSYVLFLRGRLCIKRGLPFSGIVSSSWECMYLIFAVGGKASTCRLHRRVLVLNSADIKSAGCGSLENAKSQDAYILVDGRDEMPT